MKRVLALALLLVATLTLVGCSSNTTTEEVADDTFKVVFMVNGTLGDLSFFDSAAAGLKLAEDKYGDKIETKIIEAGYDDTKWEPTLIDLSEEDWDLIITGTWTMVEILQNVATEYPDQNYLIFDSAVDYSLGLENVYSITYKQNEGAFLAGALAAEVTSMGDDITNPEAKIGFLGGMDIPVINDFLVGYIQGAKYVNENIEVVISYVGDFNDSAKGKEIALNQYAQGVDIGFNVAGAAGIGQIDAAKEVGKYAIGVDADQASIFADTDIAKANLIVTSVLKRVDMSLLRAIDLAMEGKLPVGQAEGLGFAEESVGLAYNDFYSAIVPADVDARVKAVRDQIIAGEIVVDTAFGMTTEQLSAIKDSVS